MEKIFCAQIVLILFLLFFLNERNKFSYAMAGWNPIALFGFSPFSVIFLFLILDTPEHNKLRFGYYEYWMNGKMDGVPEENLDRIAGFLCRKTKIATNFQIGRFSIHIDDYREFVFVQSADPDCDYDLVGVYSGGKTIFTGAGDYVL